MRGRFHRREYVEYHCSRGYRQLTPQREIRTFDALSVVKQVGEIATGNRKDVMMDITIDQALNASSSLIRSRFAQRFNFIGSSRETSQGSKTFLWRNSVLSWKPNSVSMLRKYTSGYGNDIDWAYYTGGFHRVDFDLSGILEDAVEIDEGISSLRLHSLDRAFLVMPRTSSVNNFCSRTIDTVITASGSFTATLQRPLGWGDDDRSSRNAVAQDGGVVFVLELSLLRQYDLQVKSEGPLASWKMCAYSSGLFCGKIHSNHLIFEFINLLGVGTLWAARKI